MLAVWLFLNKGVPTANFAINYRLWENNQGLDFQLERLLKHAYLAHKTRNSVIVSEQIS
jgi:hypothetical protein